ncbi:MAG: hypothetical protein GY873_06080 [Bosea sp.]|uniref:hypothetical protein n=1 Tax=Bosea sp. (in: a-proteobacteria) TaxID=1871050 RepID=UPI00239C112C|nr:hypothetical protein [Bosea sp. (in: a-proteobacteria)]MCP4733748.1 hypothetical protein [Bosea sp. (in: a-proteobacteria)]
MQYHHRLRSLAFCLLGLLSAQHPATAEAPAEIQGKWSSQPGRCEPISGEVDVLTITAAELGFYEIGCDLGQATRSGARLRFDAQCYKGGSPVTPGEVVLRRHAPNEIDLVLQGFSWIAAKPQRYHRC